MLNPITISLLLPTAEPRAEEPIYVFALPVVVAFKEYPAKLPIKKIKEIQNFIRYFSFIFAVLIRIEKSGNCASVKIKFHLKKHKYK